MMKNVICMMAFCLLFTSCASIIHGPTQVINFASDPIGATITIDGKDHGQTPKAITLRRVGKEKGDTSEKMSYAVKISMEGYEPYETIIMRKVDGWIVGNLIFGGLIGIAIDAANGSMYKLTPEQITGKLGNSSAAIQSGKGDQIFVAVALNIDPSWEKIGQLKAN